MLHICDASRQFFSGFTSMLKPTTFLSFTDIQLCAGYWTNICSAANLRFRLRNHNNAPTNRGTRPTINTVNRYNEPIINYNCTNNPVNSDIFVPMVKFARKRFKSRSRKQLTPVEQKPGVTITIDAQIASWAANGIITSTTHSCGTASYNATSTFPRSGQNFAYGWSMRYQFLEDSTSSTLHGISLSLHHGKNTRANVRPERMYQRNRGKNRAIKAQHTV